MMNAQRKVRLRPRLSVSDRVPYVGMGVWFVLVFAFETGGGNYTNICSSVNQKLHARVIDVEKATMALAATACRR